MPIAFNCPSCDKLFSVPDEMAGRNATCNNCGTTFTVPMLDEDEDDSSQQPISPMYSPSPRTYRQPTTQIPWGTIILLLAVVGIAVFCYYKFRDTWEEDNRAELIALKDDADKKFNKAEDNKKFNKAAFDKARSALMKVVDHVGERKLKDEKLARLYKDAQNKLATIRDREEEQRIQQQRDLELKQMEEDKKLAQAEKERIEAIQKEQELERIKKEEALRKLEEDARKLEEEQKKRAEQERLAEEKRLREQREKEKITPRVIATVVTPVNTPKPEDSGAGDECPLCNGLKKGNFTYNDPYIWYDQNQPTVVVRVTTRMLFTPSENGSELCPACGGKGKGVGIQPTGVLTIDLPGRNICKNCSGFGRLIKCKLDNKFYGYPYGGVKCTKCLGTGKINH